MSGTVKVVTEQCILFLVRLMQWPSTDLTNMTNVDGRQVYMVTYISLLLRRFVFRIIELSAKSELLVMNRKEPWERYRRQAKPMAPNAKKPIALLTSEHTTKTKRNDLLGNLGDHLG